MLSISGAAGSECQGLLGVPSFSREGGFGVFRGRVGFISTPMTSFQREAQTGLKGGPGAAGAREQRGLGVLRGPTAWRLGLARKAGAVLPGPFPPPPQGCPPLSYCHRAPHPTLGPYSVPRYPSLNCKLLKPKAASDPLTWGGPTPLHRLASLGRGCWNQLRSPW